MAHQSLECPECDLRGGTALPKKHPANEHPDEVSLKRYKCANGHEYITAERVVDDQGGLADVRIRDRGVERRSTHRTFSQQTLAESVARYVPKMLSSHERAAVVNEIMAVVRGRVAEIKRGQSDDEVTLNVDALVDLALQGFENVARRPSSGDAPDRFKTAHISYALATLGTRNPRKPWKGALEFLQWLTVTYPETSSGVEPELAHDWRPPKVEWYVPTRLTPPTAITTVVKNTRIRVGEVELRRKDDFEAGKVQRSIQAAMRGRGDGQVAEKSRSDAQMAERVYQYVMWGLVGQKVVRSSQISAAVAEVLRGLDDIAYLRWVVIGKEMQPRQVYDEAMLLVQYPSPRIRFVGTRRASMHATDGLP